MVGEVVEELLAEMGRLERAVEQGDATLRALRREGAPRETLQPL
eukprot:SAG11_NODE_17361_length_520_cov_6.513064_1_plen_43_part_01